MVTAKPAEKEEEKVTYLFTRDVEGTESDAIVRVSLSLIEAMSTNAEVPTFFSETILRSLSSQIKSRELTYTDMH
jgi:hypothetical protein